MVANRLIDSLSKLAISRWYQKKVYLRELENTDFAPHNFCRSMDFLEKMKEDIKGFLYNKLCDLFSLKLNLVFYDTTSSYFEGEGPSMAKYGKSRDHCPDKHQIVIGPLVTDEGIPIAHEVFDGDEVDKATVVKTIDDLEEKRKSYEEKKSRNEEKSEKKKKELLFSEYRSGDGPRYLVCLNPEKKKDDEIYRVTRIEKAKRNLEKIERSVETGRLKNREKVLKKTALALDKTNRK